MIVGATNGISTQAVVMKAFGVSQAYINDLFNIGDDIVKLYYAMEQCKQPRSKRDLMFNTLQNVGYTKLENMWEVYIMPTRVALSNDMEIVIDELQSSYTPDSGLSMIVGKVIAYQNVLNYNITQGSALYYRK
jgi:hypothetical protein